MRRWLFAILVLIAVYARYHRSWQVEDIRVEGVTFGEELSAVRQRVPTLRLEDDEWRTDCPHHGLHHSFESWGLSAPHGRVERVCGWHLQVGPHHFAPLQPQSLIRLQALLGPGRSPQASIYLWPQYHLKVSVDGNHDSVTLVTLE